MSRRCASLCWLRALCALALCASIGMAGAARSAGAEDRDGRLAASPPMGWNSWDAYGLTIDEAQFRANAAVLVFNLDGKPRAVRMMWSQLGIASGMHRIRDLWNGGTADAGGLEVTLPAHGCAIYRLE